jgi:carbonic anhydrase
MTTKSVSPEKALELLKAGNERFVHNRRIKHDLLVQMKETASGQQPFAAILGCIDSRAVPELIFDQGIGDLFSVRVAGNVID